jgi:hypothetical protein
LINCHAALHRKYPGEPSTMTTLIAWISIDQRAPSAFYMASDSRISWGSERARWDAGRKLFTCRRHPDIFGYTGDVVFPSLVLGQITEAADAALLFRSDDDSENRHAKFLTAVRASFSRRHNAPDADFRILHGSRQFSGPKAQFKLWCLSFRAATRSWSDTAIDIPFRQSTLLAAFGSGAESMTSHSRQWETAQGGTSRAIFGAFCDSLRSRADPLSGGIPQLVGMYHTRMPQAFGIICDNQRYLHGFPLPPEVHSNVMEWRDELLQRVDGTTLKIMQGAQRHARPRPRQ